MVETITPAARDFTNRDFDSWIIELRNRANAAFPGWTDFNAATFGNILLEMFAHTLDVLSFTQDQQYLETRVAFATLRRSMIALGKLVAFRLPGAKAATVDLELTIADGNPRLVDVVVPKGTVVRTLDLDEEVEFDLTADATIPAGSVQITNAAAENARERVQAFVAAGVADDKFLLGLTPYVDGSAVVTVGVDVWDEKENLLSSGPTDRHFFVDVDENDRATVRTGDGINGAIPVGAVSIVFKTGGGASGNVDANALREFRDGSRFPSNDGEEVQLLVRNPAAVGDGVDRMSVEEARVAIPAHSRTVGKRSVTRRDFEDNARKVRGVARVLMLTSDEEPLIPENSGRMHIVPVGGGLPSAALKAEVLDFILTEHPPTLTFSFTVEDPVLLVVPITATVFLNVGITEAVARAAAESALDDFFALVDEDGAINEQIDFGLRVRQNKMPPGSLVGEIPWSDLFNALRDATTPAGALVFRKIEEDSFVPADDVAMDDIEFPVLGAINLVNGATGLGF